LPSERAVRHAHLKHLFRNVEYLYRDTE